MLEYEDEDEARGLLKEAQSRDLAKDLAICDRATEGPWTCYGPNRRGFDKKKDLLTRRFYKITWDDDFVLPGIAMVNDYEPPSDDGLCAEPTAKDNAAFIVEARTGWPAAIRRAMAAEAELERLRAKPQPRKGRAKAKPLQRKG